LAGLAEGEGADLADLVDSAVGEVVAVAAAPDGNKKNCRIAELQDCRKEGRKEFLQILPAILQFCNSAILQWKGLP
jgi:hypothetical protein